MKQLRLSAALCASLLLPLPLVSAEAALPMESRVGHYIETYGLADRSQPQIQRAHAIFQQLRQVADSNARFYPTLQVIKATGDPWVIALPDGNIVLTNTAVELAYRDADERTGDARIAFMLGHELAHLSRDHYWHRDVFRLLTEPQSLSPEQKNILRLLSDTSDAAGTQDADALAEQREKEHEADDRGFIYAALAGYAVNTLLAQQPGADNFFTHWMRQTHTRLSPTHPHPEERAALLQTRLNRVTETLAFYRVGVQLAHFQRYDDALFFLDAFQQVYPGREVLNNIGYIYLQQARKAMGVEQAYRYCLPTLLDTQSRAAGLITRGSQNPDERPPLTPEAQEYLEKAVVFFKRAVEADPHYLPARLNLTAAYLYLDQIYLARAVIEEARVQTPDDAAVANLRALVLYQDRQATDMWSYALAELEKLTANAPADTCARFNEAQLLEERGRQGKAQAVWVGLTEQLGQLSRYQQAVVCDHAGKHPACIRAAQTDPQATPALPWALPIAPGADLMETPSLQTQLASAGAALPYDWGQEGMTGNIYQQTDGTSVLDLDSYVELIVLNRPGLGTVADLERCCGTPTRRETVVNGELWNYGNRWAVLVQDGQIREVWVVRS